MNLFYIMLYDYKKNNRNKIMKIKLYVQVTDIDVLYQFFKNDEKLDFEQKKLLHSKIKKVKYWVNMESVEDMFLDVLAEIYIDYEDYIKLEYID